MKTRIRILFARRGFDKYNTARVDIEIYYDRDTRQFIDTGLRLRRDEWNNANNLPYATTREGRAYLKIIQDLQRKIEDHELTLLERGERLRPYLVNALIRGTNTGPALLLCDFIEAELIADNTIETITVRMHKQTLTKLRAYNPNAKLSDVNYDYIVGFHRYLTALKLAGNTIERHHNRLRKYLIVAYKRELIKKMPYQDFKLHKEPTNRQALTVEEVRRIEALDYSGNPRLQRVQRLFLFGCWTGLRFCELEQLTINDCHQTEKGWEIVLHKIRKYPTPVFLPLYALFDGKPNELLTEHFMTTEGLDLRLLNDAQVNEDLKVIAADCRITKPLSYYIARHTFATMVGLHGDAYLVMTLLGHKSLKTSLVYVKSTPEIVRRKLGAYRWD